MSAFAVSRMLPVPPSLKTNQHNQSAHRGRHNAGFLICALQLLMITSRIFEARDLVLECEFCFAGGGTLTLHTLLEQTRCSLLSFSRDHDRGAGTSEFGEIAIWGHADPEPWALTAHDWTIRIGLL